MKKTTIFIALLMIFMMPFCVAPLAAEDTVLRTEIADRINEAIRDHDGMVASSGGFFMTEIADHINEAIRDHATGTNLNIGFHQNEITALAYEMQAAYHNEKTQGAAIESVKKDSPYADLNILWAMWAAIDAYVDMQ